METLSLIEAQYPFLLYLTAGLFGAVIGSFLNVVILRVPQMMDREMRVEARAFLELPEEGETPRFNLVYPNSHCPNCEHKIRPWENIPIVSYLFLGGKCSDCKQSISLRYPLTEALSAILTILVVYALGANLSAVAVAFLTFALITLSMIDFDHMILPDDITLPFLWLGLICNAFGLITSFENAFWGAVGGYLCLWSVFHLFRLITGKEGMGYGDFKLLALLGAWAGWQMIPLIIILSSLAGAVIGGMLILFGRDKNHPIPFGPYLAIAGYIAVLWGQEITMSYLRFLA